MLIRYFQVQIVALGDGFKIGFLTDEDEEVELLDVSGAGSVAGSQPS